MKKSLIALFILTSVLAFSEGNVKKVPYESMTKTDNGIAYFGNEKTPFTGIVEKKSKDGKLEAVISLKDGKLDGKTFTYYPNGKVKREETFQNALVNGTVKSYSENGILEYEANYNNDKIDGLEKYYYPNGKVEKEIS